MLHRWKNILPFTLAIGLFGLAGCSSLVTAYLVRELLNDKAPKKTWSGKVSDVNGEPVEGVTVSIRAEIADDEDALNFDDETDASGNYSISYRWNEEVNYVLRVKRDDVILHTLNVGKIELEDRVDNITIQATANATISGLVQDAAGDPLEGVLIIGASAADLDANPVVLLDTGGATQFQVTGESGVYQLTGSVAQFAVVCAYHPARGFAYAVGEDNDSDGSVALNVPMGATGDFTLNVQVVDGTGAPVANQVLTAARQFRLHLYTPFNLASTVDEVVADNDLFPGLGGLPSSQHPSAISQNVQATGAAGFLENPLNVEGGTYSIELLQIDNDAPATALVNSPNPLALSADTTVVVRVN